MTVKQHTIKHLLCNFDATNTAERRNHRLEYFSVFSYNTNYAVVEGFDLPQIVQYLAT